MKIFAIIVAVFAIFIAITQAQEPQPGSDDCKSYCSDACNARSEDSDVPLPEPTSGPPCFCAPC